MGRVSGSQEMASATILVSGSKTRLLASGLTTGLMVSLIKLIKHLIGDRYDGEWH